MPHPGWPLGTQAGSSSYGVPGAAPSEEACGQGLEAGSCEPVQLLKDLHLLLVHLWEEGAEEKSQSVPPALCFTAGLAGSPRLPTPAST